MGLLARLLGTDTSPPDHLTVRSIAVPNPSNLSGVPGQAAFLVAGKPELALAQPTVFSAIRMISHSVSSMPVNSYLVEARNIAPDQPAIVRQPDPFQPREVTMKQLTTATLLRGEAFAWLTAHGRDGRPTVAIPIHNDEVMISWDKQRIRPVYEWRHQPMTLDRDIMHIKYVDDPSKLHGIGPVQAISGSISGALKADQLSATQYSEGAWVDGVLEAPNKLTEKEAKRLRGQWDTAHAGKRGTAVLEGGIAYKPVMMSNADSQLLEGRQWYAREFARIFGIPAPLLGLPMGEGSSLTYQNIEGVKSQYAQFAVQPVTDAIEAAFTRLVPSTQHVLFQFAALLRADISTRYAVYTSALAAGILTVNEVRSLEGLPDLPGGDVPTTATTTTPAAEQPTPTPAQEGATP